MKHAWIHLVLQCCTVIISSNGETVENLTVIEGGAITFPQSVVGSGFLIYGRRNIAFVSDNKTTILQNYWKDKVQWSNTTGFFTITGLQTSDSGSYSVQGSDGATTDYEVTVFESISIPSVVSVNVTSENCTLVCAVEKPAGTTLSWYQDGERVKQSSSSLSLPLTITWQEFSSSYRCEANTPAEGKQLKANATSLCSGDRESAGGNSDNQGTSVIPIVVVVVVMLLIIPTGYYVFKWKFSERCQRREDTQRKEPEVVYSDISIVKNQGRQSPRPVQPVDENNLTTIYSKLEVHNMTREAPC